jgi:CheY-like chemotaxis protein
MERRPAPRILIVDDESSALERTLQAIRRLGRGYEARIAVGGFEAIDYLLGRGRFHERRRHPLPDLVLLKFAMLPIDGGSVLRRINHLEHLRHIPVVALCESEHERQRAMSSEARADAYLVKPLSPESLEDLFDRFTPLAPESQPPAYAAMRLE